MTNKIAITLIAILVMTIIVPTVYAQQRDVSKEQYGVVCDNILNDDRRQWHEFGCTYFPEIWNWINELFTITSDHEQRLQVLEGKIPPPEIGDPLTMFVIPDTISAGETFTVHGHVDRVEQSWVDFVVYDPNGQVVQHFDFETLQNGGYYPSAIVPNNNWKISGNYTITAIHGPHTETATIQYLGENP